MGVTRIFPSSFDPIPELEAIRREQPWTSCRDALAHFGARTVIMQTPFFWQLFSPLHDVCRELRVLIYPSEPENMPAAAEALLRADANVIICPARDAEEFAAYIIAKHYPLPAWILIHRALDTFSVPPTLQLAHARVAHEIHSSPGVPMLVQCAALIDEGNGEFHTTGAHDTGLRLTESGLCSCGVPRYRKV